MKRKDAALGRALIPAVCAAATLAGTSGSHALVGVTRNPVDTLLAFARAARAGDTVSMRRLAAVRPGGAHLLATSRARLAELTRPRILLDERISGRFAVAVLSGRGRTFAAALQVEGGRWRVLIGGPVRLHAVRPNPGERVTQRTQLAAGVEANAAILEAGLWMDGVAVPANGGPLGPRRVTMWQEAPQPLRRGSHVVIAFASTAGDAAALAWMFHVR